MPRGPSRQWRKLMPHTEEALPYIKAALHYGHGKPMAVTEITHESFFDFRRGLFNAAKLLGCSVHISKAERLEDGSWSLTYVVFTKSAGRAYVLAKHGEDRSQWPYNPRRRATKEGDAA